jgi:hypothetical protein
MAFATEMLVQFAKEGYKMVEVPTTYKTRKYGKTKLKKFKSGIEISKTILRGLLDADMFRKFQENWQKNQLER